MILTQIIVAGDVVPGISFKIDKSKSNNIKLNKLIKNNNLLSKEMCLSIKKYSNFIFKTFFFFAKNYFQMSTFLKSQIKLYILVKFQNQRDFVNFMYVSKYKKIIIVCAKEIVCTLEKNMHVKQNMFKKVYLYCI